VVHFVMRGNDALAGLKIMFAAEVRWSTSGLW
jgi:hypothetical protein